MTGNIDRQRAEAEAMAIAQARSQAQPRGIGQTIYENVIGSGEVDTPGERIGEAINEMGRAFFPGVARGAAEMAGIPGTVSDLLDVPFERLGLLPSVDGLSDGNPLSGAALRGYMSDATNGATEFRSETVPGRVAGTVGEFIPGATGAGARGLLGFGVIPGIASETAGMAAEGTAAEPYARLAGGLLGTVLGGGMTGATNARPRPIGSNAEQQRLAAYLQRQGVQPTAGQTSGSNLLRRMEGTVTPRVDQLEDLTTAAMRSIGSQEARATPQALRDAAARIGQVMDDSLQGVSFQPTQAMAQMADDVVDQYLQMAPASTVVPRVRNIADEIIEAATNPAAPSIDLSTLRVWRSALGRMTQSSDEATREAARSLRALIDDATDAALVSAGRDSDIQALSQAREQWRNYLAVSDAATRVGSESGVLSPTQLNQAVIRTQGRQNYATGNGTDLMETTRAAGQILRPMPTVEAGGIRRLPYVGELGASGGGAAAGYALGNVPGAIIGGLLGATVPTAGQAAMRSRTVQSLLMDPTLSAAVASRSAPGLLAGN